MFPRHGSHRWFTAASVVGVAGMLAAGLPLDEANAARKPRGRSAQAASSGPTLPAIRTSAGNDVPACVTTDGLTRFLASGNPGLKPQFRDIARHYKAHGEKHKVRWDYAFFQMIIETNYLKFVNNAGQGDVNPKQNNFAGIGTTGGGVPGDSFPDVSTGVLGQIQHLVAYSGERVERPVAPRTREKQDEIMERSRALGRAPTFKDLAGRWAADRRYGASIEFIAQRYRAAFCNGRDLEPEPLEASAKGRTKVAAAETSAREAPRDAGRRGRQGERPGAAVATSGKAEPHAAPLLSEEELTGEAAESRTTAAAVAPTLVAAPRAAKRPTRCTVLTASYGGEKNVLIRAVAGSEMQLTALQVLEGQEQKLAESFIRTHAAGGEPLGLYDNRQAALLKAFELCPSGSISASVR